MGRVAQCVPPPCRICTNAIFLRKPDKCKQQSPGGCGVKATLSLPGNVQFVGVVRMVCMIRLCSSTNFARCGASCAQTRAWSRALVPSTLRRQLLGELIAPFQVTGSGLDRLAEVLDLLRGLPPQHGDRGTQVMRLRILAGRQSLFGKRRQLLTLPRVNTRVERRRDRDDATRRRGDHAREHLVVGGPLKTEFPPSRPRTATNAPRTAATVVNRLQRGPPAGPSNRR